MRCRLQRRRAGEPHGVDARSAAGSAAQHDEPRDVARDDPSRAADGARDLHVDAAGVRPVDDVDGRRDPRRQSRRRQRRRQAGRRTAPPRLLPRLRHRRDARCDSPTSTALVNGCRATSSGSCRCSSARRCSANRSRSSATARNAATACTSPTCVAALDAAADAAQRSATCSTSAIPTTHTVAEIARGGHRRRRQHGRRATRRLAGRSGADRHRVVPHRAARGSPPPSDGGRRSTCATGCATRSPSTGSTRGTCRRREPPRRALRGAFAEVAERIARRRVVPARRRARVVRA